MGLFLRKVLSVCLVGLYVLKATSGAGNMNGKYSIASGADQDVDFNDDYASKGHSYFDLYTQEIATHYGDVFWTDMAMLSLPDEIVSKFNGTAIAITGYEHDQVMVQPQGKPGVDPSKDVSVPINWAYNHHYMFWIVGQHAELRRVPAKPNDPMAHGASMKWIGVDLPSAKLRTDTSIPTNSWFSEGNGGESRKSFHGYPKGYAQLVDSPITWHMTPMQVDTRNRDCGVTPADIGRCKTFAPGPEPQQARFGRGIPKEGTNYSGLLECPCSSRFGGDPSIYGADARSKLVTHEYETLLQGSCGAKQHVRTAEDCFRVVQTLAINATGFRNETVSDPDLPPACSVVSEADGTASVYFNTGGKAQCSAGTTRRGQSLTSHVGVTLGININSTGLYERSPQGHYCSDHRRSKLKAFFMESDSRSDAYKALEECESFCLHNSSCWGCSVDCETAPLSYGILTSACQFNALSSCGERRSWAGSVPGDVSALKSGGGQVTITASGPADSWFGVGINARLMAYHPYTLVVNDAGVTERKLGTCGDEGSHCAGTELKPSVKVLSNSVSGGIRTVVMTRPLQGLTKDHFTFDTKKDQTMPLITAVGASQSFGYHKAHAPSEITLTSVGASSCVCDLGIAGQLCHTDGSNCKQFEDRCVPEPAGDLVAQVNPTCSSRSYVGGLECARHGESLLDKDQEIPPELLRYHIKLRIWYQEYRAKTQSRPASHYDLERIYYQTEANAGEYDVPPAFARPGEPIPGYPGWPLNKPTPGTSCTGDCPNGPDCDCVYTITYHWKVSELRLVYAGGHCHAPSCISIELYRNDTGTPRLICRQLPKIGRGGFPENKWDEAGYIALPPCLWGEEKGLQPSEWMPKDTPLFSVKKNRNTHSGHYGEMASWQMRGVRFPGAAPDLLI